MNVTLSTWFDLIWFDTIWYDLMRCSHQYYPFTNRASQSVHHCSILLIFKPYSVQPSNGLQMATNLVLCTLSLSWYTLVGIRWSYYLYATYISVPFVFRFLGVIACLELLSRFCAFNAIYFYWSVVEVLDWCIIVIFPLIQYLWLAHLTYILLLTIVMDHNSTKFFPFFPSS